jgi:hypothetical protein
MSKIAYSRKGKTWLLDSEREYFSDEFGVAMKPDFSFTLPGNRIETEETSVQHCFINKTLENVEDREGTHQKKG